MFGSLVLEVAVGLTFVFLLMSLVVTSITELLAGWLKLRAGTLWRGMQNLLSDEWAVRLYEHPLIRGFVPQRPAPRSTAVRAWRLLRRAVLPQAKGPSYIPSRTFALALLDSLRDPALDRLRQDLRAALDRLPEATATARDVVEAVQEVVAKLPDPPDGGAAGAVKAEIGRLLGRASFLEAPGALARRDVEALLDRLAGREAQEWMIRRAGEGQLGRVLAALAEEAQGDAEKLKESLEVWFNNGMERVGGWYKRKSQAIQVLLALLVTVAANVDTLQITRRLAQDSALRQAIVAEAEAFETAPAAPAQDLDALQERIERLGLPLGWVCAGEEVDEARAELRLVPWCDPTGRTELGSTLRSHLLGWLLSVLALSLGAPFWFDVLNKVATVRSAGKAPEERPRPPKEVPVPLEPGETPREADLARAAGRR